MQKQYIQIFRGLKRHCFNKKNSKEFTNYRTIAHKRDILLKIILKKMKISIQKEVTIEQAGFRRSQGTRDHNQTYDGQ